MKRDESGEDAPSNGGGRPVWMQIAIGAAMSGVVLTALYFLFARL